MMKKIILYLLLICLLPCYAFAFQPFVVRSIEIQGLQRVSRQTMVHYLPFREGETINSKRSADIVAQLYKTGFFQNVRLARKGNTLVIVVEERSTISSITIKGNKLIPTKKLKTVLSTVGLISGQPYNISILKAIKQELITEYRRQGHYNIKVITDVKQEPQNRVAIKITIKEGKPLKVKSIIFVGNHAFTSRQLARQLKMKRKSIISFFMKNDRYSKENLQANLELLRNFYLNHGYIEFKVLSYDANINNDNETVDVTIRLSEGPQYKISGYRLTGQLIVPLAELKTLIKLKPGDIFSRQRIMESNQAMAKRLGDEGYAYPLITTEPRVDQKARTVFLIFKFNPGRRYYVRRINYTGNYRTSNIVMRREMRQFESGVFNGKQIQDSVHRLKQLGYFKNVGVKLKPVPGKPDQLDLDFNVTEVPGGQITFGVGYDTNASFLINASLKQNNFLGTGNTLNVDLNTSRFRRSYSITYNNPYYTINGISRGFEAYYTRSDPDKIGLSRYSVNRMGGNVIFGFPLSDNDNDRLILTVGGRHLEIKTVTNRIPLEVAKFLAKKGNDFQQLLTTISWVHNSYDQAIFPTKGLLEDFRLTTSLPLGGNSLTYYVFDYFFHWYQPLYRSFILSFRGEFGYGDGFGNTEGLPFFENFFAGGIDSVRGYRVNSLGPRDRNINAAGVISRGDPIGANSLILGSVGLIVPNPISKDNIRTTLFFDFGSVYQLNRSYGLVTTGIDLSKLGYSVGLGVEWRTPIGPLSFSLAHALNRGKNMRTRVFDFSIGTSI